MDVEVVGKFLSTLPEDDDHPYRTGPWRPQTTEWRADDLAAVEGEIPTDIDGVYLRNTENPVHPALLPQQVHPHRRFHRRERGRPPVVGGAGGAAEACRTRRVGCAWPDEGCVEHRRDRAPRHCADKLLPMR